MCYHPPDNPNQKAEHHLTPPSKPLLIAVHSSKCCPVHLLISPKGFHCLFTSLTENLPSLNSTVKITFQVFLHFQSLSPPTYFLDYIIPQLKTLKISFMLCKNYHDNSSRKSKFFTMAYKVFYDDLININWVPCLLKGFPGDSTGKEPAC